MEEEEFSIDEDEKELNDIDEHIEELKKEEIKEQKKKKKIADKERKKLQERMSLKMIIKNHEAPGLQEEGPMFGLHLIKSKKQLKQVSEQKPEILAESDVESDEDALPKPKTLKYNTERTHLDSSGK